MEYKQNHRIQDTIDLYQYGKIPPQCVDIEECVLGALMLDSEVFGLVSPLITEISFYKEENRIIYKSICDLNNNNKTVDLMLVTQKLKNSCELEKVGGAIYLTKLTNSVSYGIDIEQYARIIAEKFAKRESIRICSEIINKSYNDESDIEEIINDIQKAGIELERHFDSVDSGTTTMEVAKETLEEIYTDVDRNRKGLPSGINTGFSDLNRMIGGFKPATFIIIASRPSIGKTSLGLHFTINAAFKNKWVNIFSFEMTKTQLFKILISGESEVDRTNIRDGKLTDNELSIINKATGNIDHLPIIWNTRPMTVHQIKSVIRKNHKKNKCDLVIIDYLQLIKPTDSKAIREQQISEMTRELKLMTVEFNIPIIALCQLNRLAATEIPQLHHLRESGAIEQDADNVIFPFKEVDGEMNEISYSLINAKARNGTTGRFEIWHNEQMTKFGNKEDERIPKRFDYNPNQQFEPNKDFENKSNDIPF